MRSVCKTQLHTLLSNNSKQSDNEIEKTIPFTVAWKRRQCRGINLAKEVQNVNTENYKI